VQSDNDDDPDFVINDDDDDDEFESDFETDSENQVAMPEVDVALICNICSCEFTDIEDRTSSFVTSTACDHAVCVKCYLSIIFRKDFYTCSICKRSTRSCRMYTQKGIQELQAINAKIDPDAIKRHWGFLRKDNMLDKTGQLNDIQKLQAELVKLRSETTRANHDINMVLSDNQLLQQQLEFRDAESKRESQNKQKELEKLYQDKLKLQEENNKLKEENNKLQEENNTLNGATKNLQNQLDAQIGETRLKMEQFAQQHNNLMDKFKNLL
jgi:hypothetical protein